MNHITVLKQEAVALLQLQPHSVVVDATYGAGGHAEEICRTLSSNGTYIGLDADKTAFTDSFLYQKSDGPKFHLINENFAKITDVLSSLHIEKVDAILADLIASFLFLSLSFRAMRASFSLFFISIAILRFLVASDAPLTRWTDDRETVLLEFRIPRG